MLRSCYSSRWRIYPDSEATVRGRYYFVGDADIAPFPTFLVSNTWWPGNLPMGDGLGEVAGQERIWTNGYPPPGALAAPRASPEQFRDGMAPQDCQCVPIPSVRVSLSIVAQHFHVNVRSRQELRVEMKFTQE